MGLSIEVIRVWVEDNGTGPEVFVQSEFEDKKSDGTPWRITDVAYCWAIIEKVVSDELRELMKDAQRNNPTGQQQIVQVMALANIFDEDDPGDQYRKIHFKPKEPPDGPTK
jgi:hypothetical protein